MEKSLTTKKLWLSSLFIAVPIFLIYAVKFISADYVFNIGQINLLSSQTDSFLGLPQTFILPFTMSRLWDLFFIFFLVFCLVKVFYYIKGLFKRNNYLVIGLALSLMVGFVVGAFSSFVVGLPLGLIKGMESAIFLGLIFGLLLGLAFDFSLGLWFGFEAGIISSIASALIFVLAFGSIIGIVAGLGFGIIIFLGIFLGISIRFLFQILLGAY